MLKTMLDMIAGSNLAVLATAGPNGPHASLMTYAASQGGRVLHLLTSARSRKFANLMLEPRVSLLIDDRVAAGERGGTFRALTVGGEARMVEQPERRQELIENLVASQPGLAGLAAAPDCRVLEVRVRSLLLLEGPSEATYLELD